MDFERIFVVGCGYIGRRVAHVWNARGMEVHALTRNHKHAAGLEQIGIKTAHGDLDEAHSLVSLELNDALVYYFAPPPPAGVTDTRMRSFVSVLNPVRKPSGFVLISTTGVYGDLGGAWVDETTPVHPGNDRARRRLDAEHVLRAWGRSHEVPVVVLRVAGIYALDRLPIARIQLGEPVVQEEECPYTNRIHADDVVRVCVAAAERGKADQVYNVSDGHPGTMTQYFNAVADAHGLPRPPAISMELARRRLSPGMLSYLAESRRLDNQKMLKELAVTLKYPNLQAGLATVKQD